jgi:hypothetical protein
MGMRRRKWRTALLLALAMLGPLAARQPAGIRWRQLDDGAVRIVYPAGNAATARRLLGFAVDLLPRLETFWQIRVPGRVAVLLDDSSDRAGSSSSCLPFNRIELRLASPAPESESSLDSLELALTREFNRLCLMHAVHPWLRSLHSVFGDNFLLHPVAALPGWILDGLTIHGESSFGERGRRNTPDQALMIAAMGRERRIPSLRQMAGQVSFWPGSRYRPLLGGTFFDFLADRYGHDALVAYLRRQGDLVSFVSAGYGFPGAFGADLRTLWQAYRAQHAAGDKPAEGERFALTRSGFYKEYPLQAAPGKVLYFRSDDRRFDAVEEVDADSGRTRERFRLADVSGMSLDPDGRRLWLSAHDAVAGWKETSDLFEYDLLRDRLHRLTRGRHLAMPAADPNGGGLYCVMREGERYRLVRFDPQTRKLQRLTPLYPGLAHPAPSPDGRRVAVSLKQERRNWAVALFTPEGALETVIAPPGDEKWHQPVWNGADLYFIAETGGSYRLARFRTGDRTVERLSGDDDPALRSFSFSPDGAWLVFSGFSAGGFEVGRRPLAGAAWQSLAAQLECPSDLPGEPGPVADKPYRSWRDLLPRGWTPAVHQVDGEYQAGLSARGMDVPGVHAYRLGAYWGLNTNEPNFLLHYTYNGFLPELGLHAERRSSLESDCQAGDVTRIENRLRLTSDWPLLVRNRQQVRLYADLHSDRLRETAAGDEPLTALDMRGVRLGLSLKTARRHYDSLGFSDGLRFTLMAQQDWRFLGSTADLTTITAEYRHYLDLPRPHLLAWRLVAADSWGGARRRFRMGGNSSQEADHDCDADLFGILRGYPSGYFSGRGGWLFNLEYRLQLLNVQRSLALSLNVNRLYLAFFADAGNLWNDRRVICPAWSYGTEINSVIYFRGVRFVFATGVAAARRPDRDARFYVRFSNGSSF